eukprot:NODE_1087_length_1288_cov_42.764326_g891_i0.p1 GENE.NODE_1087_length_1288_cov_42.764326_g891_i0~~NODE_1087_length_1288_cov_42.764326_g891_i0.p1  ORF type:complete len:220 (-),score=48.91 NODE_1087_length_1288_cov_42.764326_g891_i0:72-731(-)
MSENGSRRLDRYQLESGFQNYGIHFTPDEMTQVMDYFDIDGTGLIGIPNFISTLRGTITRGRAELVATAFSLLDPKGEGEVPFADIKALNDVRNHPDTLSRRKTVEQVTHDFISGWDKTTGCIVTFDEFMDYYQDINSGIDEDKFFELMMRNTWHISGGKGVAANTSCRRVLVVHNDGRQTVEEITNDLRIAADDLGAMRENLARQGIHDVKKILLYHN